MPLTVHLQDSLDRYKRLKLIVLNKWEDSDESDAEIENEIDAELEREELRIAQLREQRERLERDIERLRASLPQR